MKCMKEMWEKFYLYGPSGGEHWTVWYSSEPTVCNCNWYVEYARLLCRVTKSDFKSFSHFKPVNGKSTSSTPKTKMSVSVSELCCSVPQLWPTLCNPMAVARQLHYPMDNPLSMGFPRQEYWSGLPYPLPGDLPDPGIELPSLLSPALVEGFFTTEPPGNPKTKISLVKFSALSFFLS